VNLSGKMGDVFGTCPNLSFSLDGRAVRTDAMTMFQGGLCKNLKGGVDVAVHGTAGSDGTVTADTVAFKKDGK
jgi:hypothetical protein